MPDKNFMARVSEIYAEFRQHDGRQTDRIQRFRNIEPDSAQFLSMLIRVQHSKTLLEIGTSTGYSTLWLAEAIQVTQGRMTTLELDGKRSQIAQGYIGELALNDFVEFWVGDAALYLQQTQETFDFILLDAERQYYLAYWQDLKRILRKKGGVLIVDNVISHATEVQDFLEMIRLDKDFMTTTISCGAGLFMVIAH